MFRRAFALLAASALTVGPLILSVSPSTPAGAATTSCSSITKRAIIAEGFKGAISPTITSYNFKKPSTNQPNALGTTIDFGSKAVVIACVSPTDIAKLSAFAKSGIKPVMTSQQYMNYLVKQSTGAMKKTLVGGVSDYLDFGNGKEDGVGSLSTAGSIRLDSWVAGGYIFLTFSQPATGTPSAALLKLIHQTESTF
jgi:hypothetical protein